MRQDNPVRLFVTHCFSKSDDYLRVFEFLESATNFYYVNCSVPDSIPTTGGKEGLKDELRRQIEECEAVLVVESALADNQDLTMYQLLAAQAQEKTIIAMEPYGVVADVSPEIQKYANAVAPWNERLMVDVILREARHEDTHRWEVVEFDL